MTVAKTSDPQTGWLKLDILGNDTAAGLVGQVLNPEGQLVHIYRAFLYVEVVSTAASTFNFGVGATGEDAADLASAVNMLTAGAGTVWNIVGTDLATETAATTAKGLLWPADEYLTITSAAQASTGLVAFLFVKYIRLD